MGTALKRSLDLLTFGQRVGAVVGGEEGEEVRSENEVRRASEKCGRAELS